jgi:immunoglobulin-binding protein 1
VRKRRRQVPTNDSPNDLDLILFLLPSPAQSASDDEEDDADADELVREATLLLLRLTHAQAHAQLESLNQEMQLLRTMPSPPSQPPADDGRGPRKESEDVWKLDAMARGPSDKQPLMDASGKARSI